MDPQMKMFTFTEVLRDFVDGAEVPRGRLRSAVSAALSVLDPHKPIANEGECCVEQPMPPDEFDALRNCDMIFDSLCADARDRLATWLNSKYHTGRTRMEFEK